jgi:hypothetical protein
MTDEETPTVRLEVPAATWLALTDEQRAAISVIPAAVTLGQPVELDGMLLWDDGRLTGDDIAAVLAAVDGDVDITAVLVAIDGDVF